MIGAGALLLSAYLLPSESMQDLGRIAGAMLLAAIATVPFLLAFALGRRDMPRWMRATALAGAALGIVPAIVILSLRF